MSEQIKTKNSEEIKKINARLDKIEAAGRALAEGLKRIETDDIEETRVSDGEHFGVEFKPNRCDW